MAIFTSTRTLAQQKQHRNFKKQTGWKAGAMSLMGYKSTGEKNWFGKYFGHGNVLMNSYIPGALAKGSDAGEVIKSQRGAEWGVQMGSAKFASNFIGGGALGGASKGAGGAAKAGGGFFGKAGTMGKGAGGGATKAGAFISQIGGGNSQTIAKGGKGSVLDTKSMFKEGSKADNLMSSKAGKRLTDEIGSKGKQKVLDEIEGEEEINENEYQTEADYNEDAAAKAGQGEAGPIGDSPESKQTQSVAKATGKIPIVGEAIGLYSQQLQTAEGYKKKVHEIAGRTTVGSMGRRV